MNFAVYPTIYLNYCSSFLHNGCWVGMIIKITWFSIFFFQFHIKCLHSSLFRGWFMFIISYTNATLWVHDFIYLKFQWIWKLLSFDISYFSLLPKMINFFIPYICVRRHPEISSHVLDENFSYLYKYFGLYDLWLSFFSLRPAGSGVRYKAIPIFKKIRLTVYCIFIYLTETSANQVYVYTFDSRSNPTYAYHFNFCGKINLWWSFCSL